MGAAVGWTTFASSACDARSSTRTCISRAIASARISIGIAVFYGMISSTCLVVVFVPSFYVVMQRFEERRTRKKAPASVEPKAAAPQSSP
jgi:hydrophobic/amphiphilic exporter-1 (mainly G- bacteria), HAE1 family